MTIVTLIVDMQQDFFAHDRLAVRRPSLVMHINQLVSSARTYGLPIVWVKQEFLADLSDAPLEVRREGLRITIEGTPGASLLPELDVGGSDAILTKKRYSAFFGTGLDGYLETVASPRLLVLGINTHACIRSTVIDAYQRDLDVLLARDAIASHDEEHDRVSWRYMDGKLGRGFSTDDLLPMLRGEASGRVGSET